MERMRRMSVERGREHSQRDREQAAPDRSRCVGQKGEEKAQGLPEAQWGSH